jgi:hypothetical protein
MIFEIGLPRKTFTSKEEALKFINLYNGKKKALFQSVYNFKEMENNKPKYDTAIIDKLFFDFDANSDCWNECNKLHQHLKQENIQHFIIWSGRGYHLFINSIPLQSKNCKSVIYNSQIHFIKKLDLKCDMQVIGDHSRLRRIPNSWHPKAQLFCIYLSEEDFLKGLEYCKEKAKKQNFKKEIIGEKLFDLKPFDYESEKYSSPVPEFDFESSENANYLQNCPDKIKQLLAKKDLGWKERYLVILYFKERGFTRKEVLQILKNHLSERKFKHCIYEERQLQYLFERDDLMFPENFGVKIYK